MLNHLKKFVPRRSDFSNPFSPILNLLLVFGIDFYRSKFPRWKLSAVWLANKFVICCWGLVLLILTSYFKYTLRYVSDGNKGHAKLRFVRLIEVLNSCLVFYAVCRSERKISSAISQIVSLGRTFRLTDSRFALMSALMIVFFQVVMCFGVMHPYDEDRYKYIFDQFTFELLPVPDRAIVFYILLLVFNIYIGLVELFPFSIILFYGTVCKYLQNLISIYVKNLEISSREVIDGFGSDECFKLKECLRLDECFGRYDSILAALRLFEGVMSFPIFLVFSMTVFGILFGIVVLQEGYQLSYLPLTGTIVITMSCFVSFMWMSCLAAGVNESDKRAKLAHHELLKRLLPGGITLRPDRNLSFLITNYSEPPFAFTGWGFFQFTKGFLLGAIGCVVTYAFFIANL